MAHPEIAIFVKYEYWLNLLRELRRRKVRTYVVSAIFRRNSVFFRPYGGMWRQALESFDVMFVQNEESKKPAGHAGLRQCAGGRRHAFRPRGGDRPRRQTRRHRGSASRGTTACSWRARRGAPTRSLLIRLMNDNPDVKFVIAPHEMDEGRIARLIEETCGGALRYTQCTSRTGYGTRQLLILDTVGLLSSVYGYAA